MSGLSPSSYLQRQPCVGSTQNGVDPTVFASGPIAHVKTNGGKTGGATRASLTDRADTLWQNRGVVKKRLLGALLAYAVLFGLASCLLSGRVLAAVLILFCGLLAKTLIAIRVGQQLPPDETAPE
jgi:hypothetical protein